MAFANLFCYYCCAMFDPKTNKFPYTLETDHHYLDVKIDNGLVFDENYPYFDKSRKFRFKQFWGRVVITLVVFLVQIIRMGFRVKGKKNLRKNKKLLKQGYISVSNHVHMWDFIGIMNISWPRWPNVLVWDKNVTGNNSKLVRLVGGVPIPTNHMRGFAKMMRQTIDELKNGNHIHFYAEGSMWEYYAPIRPFKTGPAYFAYKADVPIVPMAYSYRKCGFIRRKIFKQIAKFTLNIGEPLFIDKSLPQQEAIEKLTIECHEKVCELAGWKKGENIYPPLYKEETAKRIDYYTKEYGVGYKGSW